MQVLRVMVVAVVVVVVASGEEGERDVEDKNKLSTCQSRLVSCLSESPSHKDMESKLRACKETRKEMERKLQVCEEEEEGQRNNMATTNENEMKNIAEKLRQCEEEKGKLAVGVDKQVMDLLRTYEEERRALKGNEVCAGPLKEQKQTLETTCNVKIGKLQAVWNATRKCDEVAVDNEDVTKQVSTLQDNLATVTAARDTAQATLLQQEASCAANQAVLTEKVATLEKIYGDAERELATQRHVIKQLHEKAQEMNDELTKRGKMFGYYLDACDASKRQVTWMLENARLENEIEKTRSLLSHIVVWHVETYRTIHHTLSRWVKHGQDWWKSPEAGKDMYNSVAQMILPWWQSREMEQVRSIISRAITWFMEMYFYTHQTLSQYVKHAQEWWKSSRSWSGKSQAERQKMLADAYKSVVQVWFFTMKWLVERGVDIEKFLSLHLPVGLQPYAQSVADMVVLVPPAFVLFLIWNFFLTAIWRCTCGRCLRLEHEDDNVTTMSSMEEEEEMSDPKTLISELPSILKEEDNDDDDAIVVQDNDDDDTAAAHVKKSNHDGKRKGKGGNRKKD